MKLSLPQRQQAISLFSSLQDELLQMFERVDGQVRAERKPWEKGELGGGTIGVMRGRVVEKAGANVSAVSGASYPAIEGEHAGKPFFAAGVSTITHMYNPHAPIAHMNVRVLDVGDRFWVGGGADLTPFIRYDEDTQAFHQAMREACSDRPAGEYERYRAWCDEYFFIKHRGETRGVGGIFFDYVSGDFSELLPFLGKVARAYVRAYGLILEKRKNAPFTEQEKDGQLYWRGRYAEFNLAYDRGTRFGLMTGGNTEAIFVSLPPVVKW